MKVYRIRNKKTGMYFSKCSTFDKKGRVFTEEKQVKSALRRLISNSEFNKEDLEIVKGYIHL